MDTRDVKITVKKSVTLGICELYSLANIKQKYLTQNVIGQSEVSIIESFVIF